MKKNEYIKVYQWMNTLRGGVLRDVYALLYQLGQKGDVKVTISYICERLKYSDRSVQNSIIELKEKGLLEVKYTDGKSSIFSCKTPEEFSPHTPENSSPHTPEEFSPLCDTQNMVADPRKIFTPEKFSPPKNFHPTPENSSPPTPYLLSLDKNLDKNTSSSSLDARARERFQKWFDESDLKEWVLRMEKSHQVNLEIETLLNDFFDNDFIVRENCERGERMAVLKHFQNWLPKYIGRLKQQNNQTQTNNGNTINKSGNRRVADLGDIAQSILAGCEAGLASRR